MSAVPSIPVRKQRTRAILAGGLVLGLGAAITLAAWSDNVFLKTDLATGGGIDLEASVQGGAFLDHDTVGTAGAITFSPSLLAGNTTYYKSVDVRLKATAANDSLVTLTQTSTAAITGLNYRIVNAATCDAAGVLAGSTLVATRAVGEAGAATGEFTLVKGNGTDPGAVHGLCFVFTAGTDLAENVAPTPLSWSLNGIAL